MRHVIAHSNYQLEDCRHSHELDDKSCTMHPLKIPQTERSRTIETSLNTSAPPETVGDTSLQDVKSEYTAFILHKELV
jgi:hypothetical protein